MENATQKKLERAERRIEILETLIEEKTRDLYLTNQDLLEKSRALEALSEELELHVRSRTDELSKSNQELERFAYVAAHDLREPLRMVASYIELLAQRYQGRLDDKADKYIHYAVEGVHRMDRLLKDLLGYTTLRSKESSLKLVDAGSALRHALGDLEGAIRECHAEVTADELPVVMADEMELRHVFENLIGNAIKFHGPDAPRVHVSTKKNGSSWIFSVQDNGIGIEPEYFERIFVICQRLHKRGEYAGNGIGLTIVKRIVERHGGRIWVESLPGRGCDFQFTLPASSERVAR